MTVRDIVEIGHPVLRTPAQPVPPAEVGGPVVQTLIDDLIETMRAAHGAGLAANQIAEPTQICVIEVDQNPRYPYKPDIALTVLVNPRFEPDGDDRFENNEGCLSVPDLRGNVWRHTRGRVRALDRQGEPVDVEVRGLTAGTYQHEIDHLNGVLFVDRVDDPTTFATWAEFDRHHRAAFVERITRFVAETGG